MNARRSLVLLALLASMAPTVVGSGSATLRGKLLPDLPQHLDVAQNDMKQGLVNDALAHLSLVLMDRPIRYRIEFADVDDERQPECVAALRDAVAMWSSALGKELKLVESAEGEPAEINIKFCPDVRQNGASVAGFVSWRRKVQEGVGGAEPTITAEIKIRTEQPDGAAMALEHMRHTAAHELGHVLGLDDSPYYGDIMGPLDLRHPVTGFEATELENLRALRSEATELRKQVLALVR